MGSFSASKMCIEEIEKMSMVRDTLVIYVSLDICIHLKTPRRRTKTVTVRLVG